MKEANVKVNILRNWQDAKMFYFLVMFAFATFIFYIFFIGQTVFRLVEGKNIENSKRILATEISELELQTLSLNDTISMEKAYELGFVTPSNTKFVTTPAFVTIR